MEIFSQQLSLKSELQEETAECTGISEQLSNEHLPQIAHLFPLPLKNLTNRSVYTQDDSHVSINANIKYN